MYDLFSLPVAIGLPTPVFGFYLWQHFGVFPLLTTRIRLFFKKKTLPSKWKIEQKHHLSY